MLRYFECGVSCSFAAAIIYRILRLHLRFSAYMDEKAAMTREACLHKPQACCLAQAITTRLACSLMMITALIQVRLGFPPKQMCPSYYLKEAEDLSLQLHCRSSCHLRAS